MEPTGCQKLRRVDTLVTETGELGGADELAGSPSEAGVGHRGKQNPNRFSPRKYKIAKALSLVELMGGVIEIIQKKKQL